jgi:uncharacterized protein
MSGTTSMGGTTTVLREEREHRGAFYLENGGVRVAALTFSAGPDGKIVMLDHTEVDSSLRGQGIAQKLVHAAVDWARERHIRLVPVCPFAKAVFAREPGLGDVLA